MNTKTWLLFSIILISSVLLLYVTNLSSSAKRFEYRPNFLTTTQGAQLILSDQESVNYRRGWPFTHEQSLKGYVPNMGHERAIPHLLSGPRNLLDIVNTAILAINFSIIFLALTAFSLLLVFLKSQWRRLPPWVTITASVGVTAVLIILTLYAHLTVMLIVLPLTLVLLTLNYPVGTPGVVKRIVLLVGVTCISLWLITAIAEYVSGHLFDIIHDDYIYFFS